MVHNIFKKTSPEDYKLHLELVIYDSKGDYVQTVDWKAELVDNKAFSYTDRLFDTKLHIPDDYALRLKLANLPAEATHIFFCIRLQNLSEIQPNQFKYTRYRLTDFDINYPFDQQEFETKYQLGDLLG